LEEKNKTFEPKPGACLESKINQTGN
jgi:hypothetical protein